MRRVEKTLSVGGPPPQGHRDLVISIGRAWLGPIAGRGRGGLGCQEGEGRRERETQVQLEKSSMTL